MISDNALVVGPSDVSTTGVSRELELQRNPSRDQTETQIMTYQFLACLTSDGRIRRLQNEIANGNGNLPCRFPHNLMKLVRLDLPLLCPRRKMARLSI